MFRFEFNRLGFGEGEHRRLDPIETPTSHLDLPPAVRPGDLASVLASDSPQKIFLINQ